MKTTVLLEVMAGKGTEIGSRFEEIARIIDGVKLKEYMGDAERESMKKDLAVQKAVEMVTSAAVEK